MKRLPILLPLLLAASCSAGAQRFDPHDPRSPLHLARTIELPEVKGRVDHMALDAEGKRLFIAENGNGSVDMIDLTSGKVAGRIGGLYEPQGVAWLPVQQEVAVASGNGLVTFYRASDLRQIAAVNLGSDADNVRIDRRDGHLLVGYGSGGLAVIDPAAHQVVRRVVLSAHPEAFELLGRKVFVNVPGAHKIVIGDLDQGRATSTLNTGLLFGNFPMASDASGSRIAVAYRVPGTLVVLNAHSGATIFSTPICGDADDLYFRAIQIIVVCGSGEVELIGDSAQHSAVLVSTKPGARTGLLDASGDRLFVAVPARQGPAAVWELTFKSAGASDLGLGNLQKP